MYTVTIWEAGLVLSGLTKREAREWMRFYASMGYYSVASAV